MASWRMVLTALLGMAMLFACANEGNAGGTPEGERGSKIAVNSMKMEDYPGKKIYSTLLIELTMIWSKS